jgi:hypothetical protein
MSADEASFPPARVLVKQTILAVSAIAAVGLTLGFAADRFATFELARDAQRVSQPRVVRTVPVDGDTIATSTKSFRAELFLPNTGEGIDPASLSLDSVRLVEDATNRLVPGSMTVGADGQSVTYSIHEPLEPGTAYRFEITPLLRDTAGDPFIGYGSLLRTDGAASMEAPTSNLAFQRVNTLGQLDQSIFTALAMQPGTNRLHAATADGRIFRWDVSPDGTTEDAGVVMTMLMNNGGPRLVTGLAFDPTDSSTLWVSHTQMALEGADDFVGKLSVLSGDDLSGYEDRIVGLPRAYKDHANFDIAFDPKAPEILYLSQGSHTSHGGPDTKWNNRAERLLSAAILRIDTSKLPDEPLDVATPTPEDDAWAGGDYDPFADDAPLTIHATGIRSGYDLLWHSSGRLMVAINGATAGGNTPAIREADGTVTRGPIMSVGITTADTLADVTRAGSYHGHPNPVRDEFVLMGGNPTDGADPYEVLSYTVGTEPEASFEMPLYDFGLGQSVNGLFESSRSGTRGDIWAARYGAGDDIVLIRTNEDGTVDRVETNIPGLTRLTSPLNVVEDPRNGYLYVTEADSNRLSVFRPTE